MSENELNLPPEPTGEGTGDSLQRAMDQLGGTSPEVTPAETLTPTETPPSPDDDNSEKSKLGRRLKRFEDRFMGVEGTLSRLEMMMSTQPPVREPTPPPDLPQTVYTPDDVVKVMDYHNQERARKAEQHRAAYEKAYVGTVLQMRGNDEQFEDVAKELLTEGVERYAAHTGNPLKDAQINYKLAKAALLEKRITNAPKPNVKGEQAVSTGVSATQRVTPPAGKSVELDPFAKKFVQGLGLNDNDPWVQGVLKK
jgi:hypothetical protein